MAIQVIVERRPEMMDTTVYVYDVYTDPLVRRVLTHEGRWEEAAPSGTAVLPSFVLPDQVVMETVHALGVPASDANMIDALRVERQRVDRLLGTLAEAVTRGL